MRHAIPYLLLCLLAMLTLSSCEHKELCLHHPHTKTICLEFDWRDAPDANPEGMCVFFYPMPGEDAPLRRIDFAGMTGGEITIQTGLYRVICYNNDTQVVNFRGMDSFDTHEGHTRECSIFENIYGSGASYAPRANGAEDERVILTPDMLWGCAAFDVEINSEGVRYICQPFSDDNNIDNTPVVTDEDIITLYPHELICHYSYEVRNVENLNTVSMMCGALSSMSPSLLIGNEELDRECVTHPFDAASDGKSTISGAFLTFGHHEQVDKPHKLVLYMWFTDGQKYYYTFDVTKQIHNAPDKRHVHIIIDGLELPQPIPNDGGAFDPSVDDWQTVEEEIEM